MLVVIPRRAPQLHRHGVLLRQLTSSARLAHKGLDRCQPVPHKLRRNSLVDEVGAPLTMNDLCFVDTSGWLLRLNGGGSLQLGFFGNHSCLRDGVIW